MKKSKGRGQVTTNWEARLEMFWRNRKLKKIKTTKRKTIGICKTLPLKLNQGLVSSSILQFISHLHSIAGLTLFKTFQNYSPKNLRLCLYANWHWKNEISTPRNLFQFTSLLISLRVKCADTCFKLRWSHCNKTQIIWKSKRSLFSWKKCPCTALN